MKKEKLQGSLYDQPKQGKLLLGEITPNISESKANLNLILLGEITPKSPVANYY